MVVIVALIKGENGIWVCSKSPFLIILIIILKRSYCFLIKFQTIPSNVIRSYKTPWNDLKSCWTIKFAVWNFGVLVWKRVIIAHFSLVFTFKLTKSLHVCKAVDREQHNMDQPLKTKNLITNQRRSIISFLVGTQQEYLALLSLHTDWIGRVWKIDPKGARIYKREGG